MFETDNEAWRGDAYLEDWPEELAGPEYWMYKAVLDAVREAID